jgi:serine O-acetyltransferase
MKLSLPKAELKIFVGKQLDHFFPDKYRFAGADIDAAFDEALDRIEYCFRFVALPGYVQDGQSIFSHLHSDHYSHFLYYFGNSLWKRSDNMPICSKLTLLNKSLNGLFCSHKLALPDIFHLEHPVGTVIGHAQYSNFLVILQNVTINTNLALKIGEGVVFSAGATVVGSKPIGTRSSIGSNTLVFDTEIPADSVVFSGSDGVTVRPRTKAYLAQTFFNIPAEPVTPWRWSGD